MFPAPDPHFSPVNPFVNQQNQTELDQTLALAMNAPENLVSRTSQTVNSIGSQAIQITPLTKALQEGNLYSALILLKAKSAFNHVSFTSLCQHINTLEETDHTIASEVLYELETQHQVLTDNRSVLANQARQAVGHANESLALLYISYMDSLTLNTGYQYFQPTLTQKALQMGLCTVAQKCIEQGADLFQTNSRSENLILLATRTHQPSIIPFLVTQGLDINQPDFHGENALHMCIKKGYLALSTLLLEQGALVDFADEQGNTPLHLAISANQPEILRLLLEKGADQEFPNANEHVPLQSAVVEDKPDAISVLLEFNGPRDSVDEGRDLIQLARFYHSHAALKTLIDEGLLRSIRNDTENAHDSVANHGFLRILKDLQNAVPTHSRQDFNQVESFLRPILHRNNQEAALNTLDAIAQEGSITFAHLEGASEHQILALIISFITMEPLAPVSISDEAIDLGHNQGSDQSDSPPCLIKVDKNTALASLIERLEDAWDLELNTSVCPSGRANRMLDTFTGLCSNAQVLSFDILKREMLDRASVISQNFNPNTSTNTDSGMLFEEQKTLKDVIRENLTHEYVTSGIISKALFSRVLDEWIDFIH